ncbi:hypothetical protein L1987_05764 [Smallanthus sonchifolius]|uniref:Uncharacterized protein n=1 Tax=Smallanthus sonchifolius TaxID=185202 RepID=A0ACB9JW97_9ASTR|nr:hypothetical protein L1987_05764 [Smallanthus sonchifolius]
MEVAAGCGGSDFNLQVKICSSTLLSPSKLTQSIEIHDLNKIQSANLLILFGPQMSQGDTLAFETGVVVVFVSSISATTGAAIFRIELDLSRLFCLLDEESV